MNEGVYIDPLGLVCFVAPLLVWFLWHLVYGDKSQEQKDSEESAKAERESLLAVRKAEFEIEKRNKKNQKSINRQQASLKIKNYVSHARKTASSYGVVLLPSALISMMAAVTEDGGAGFYTLVRLIVTGGSLAAANWFSGTETRAGWFFICAAVVFNPVIQFHLGREIWSVVDFVVAVAFVAAWVTLVRRESGQPRADLDDASDLMER